MQFNEFISKYNITLNPQQQSAVQSISGPTLLLAVPGSGKTTVIVTRLGYMIHCCGIDPSNILTMTYTVAATKDMKARFAKIFGEEYSSRLEFRTINGVCAKIISHFEQTTHRNAFKLLDKESDILGLIRGIYITQTENYPTEAEIREIRMQIAYCKNMMFTEQEINKIKVQNADFPAIYRSYCDYLTSNGLMDYDDQMVYAHKMLMRFPAILDSFRNKYRYINVDEAQDTSKIQHEIIRLLVGKSGNIFMVGDEDQSIYGFRAAYPRALLNFDKTYYNATTLLMETNYRSTNEIVKRANAFIKLNNDRHEKNMTTENSDGPAVRHTQLPDVSRQYSYLAELARDSSKETAILYRNNESALPLIDFLEKGGIPYQCRQMDSSFFSKRIVLDIVDILTFALDPSNKRAFENIYYKLGCGISKKQMIATVAGVRDGSSILWALINSPYMSANALRRLQSVQNSLRKVADLPSLPALKAITQIEGFERYLNSNHIDATRFTTLFALANQNPRPRDFIKRLEELKGIITNTSGKSKSGIILSTIHSSKGLEYDKVVLIDVADGTFPSTSSPFSSPFMEKSEKEALEEERRLFYVGATRAKEELEFISYRNEFGAFNSTSFTFINQFIQMKSLAPELPHLPCWDDKKPVSSENAISSRPRKAHYPFPTHIPTTLPPPEIAVGSLITHKAFGSGKVMNIEDGIIYVLFSDESQRKFDLNTCVRNGLIK